MKSKTSVSAHQAGIIAGVLFLTLKISSFPSILYRYSGNNSLWVFLSYVLFNIGFVSLIVWLKQRHQNVSLYNLFKKIFGVVLTKIIYFALFAFFIFKLLAICSDGYTFIKETCHKDLSLIIFLVCFIPTIVAMAYSGIRNVARTTEFFYPVLIIFMVVIIIFSAVPIGTLSSKIVLEFNASVYFSSLFDLSFWLGDALVLLVMLDKLDIQKGKYTQVFSPLLILSALIFFIYIIYYALYTQTSAFYTNAILDVLQYAVSTTDGWHMDILSIVLYMLAILFQGAVILYATKETASRLIHYKNSKITYFAIITLLVVVEFLYLNDYLAYVDFAREILHYFAFVVINIVLIMIVVALCIKRKKRRKKWKIHSKKLKIG